MKALIEVQRVSVYLGTIYMWEDVSVEMGGLICACVGKGVKREKERKKKGGGE